MEEIDTENETKLASIKCFKTDTVRIKDLARRLKLIDRRYAVSCQYVIAAALDALDEQIKEQIASAADAAEKDRMASIAALGGAATNAEKGGA